MFLKQSTASQVVELGPFVDSTDFVTAETALSIANTDIKLRKGGGTTHGNKNSGGATHIANGYYHLTLDATDTDTVGVLDVHVNASGALPVFTRFYVVEEAVYDALFAASSLGYVANAPVNVAQFGGVNGTFASGRPEVNTSHIAGSAVSTSTAQIGVNVVNFGGAAGTFASGRPEVNASHIAGAAVNTASAQLGVNVVNFGGSAGTFASGIPSVNASQFGGAPVTATTSVTIPAASTLATTTGAVGSVTGAVGSVTGSVGSVAGNVSGSVGSIATGGISSASFAAGAIDAAAIAANAIGASELAADAVDEILDEQIGDSTITMRQALKLLVATLGGKLSGAATTTVTIRNAADTTDVVTATVDASGNRSAVTLSL